MRRSTSFNGKPQATLLVIADTVNGCWRIQMVIRGVMVAAKPRENRTPTDAVAFRLP
jgi:hypothetical protein